MYAPAEEPNEETAKEPDNKIDKEIKRILSDGDFIPKNPHTDLN